MAIVSDPKAAWFSDLPAIRKEAVLIFNTVVIVITIVAASVAAAVNQFGDAAPWLISANVALQAIQAWLTRMSVFSQETFDQTVHAKVGDILEATQQTATSDKAVTDSTSFTTTQAPPAGFGKS